MFIFKRGGIYYIEYTDKKTNATKRISTGKRNQQEALQYAELLVPKTPLAPKSNELLQSMPQRRTVGEFQARYEKYVEAMFSLCYLNIVKLSFKMMIRSIQIEYIDEISFELAERFIVTRFSRAPYAANQYLRTLKAAFTRAAGWGYIAQNPFRKVKLPRLPRPLPVFISQADLQTILERTETQDLRDIFTTAFHTGMRRGEIVNLKWESVDLTANILKVESTQSFSTKWKKERIIPLNNTMVGVLTRRESARDPRISSELVFSTKKGRPYNGEFVGKKFKDAARSAGLNPKVHFHSLRHSFASNLVQRDVQILVVKELLGHEKLSTTQIYAHVKHENLSAVVKQLD
jgi:integrase/recombinase XerD